MRRRFRHAVAERAVASNVFCQVVLDEGTEGWGEGVPREYVTGETPESCFREFQSHGRSLPGLRADDVEQLVVALDEHSPVETGEPGAPGPDDSPPLSLRERYVPHAYWCACELAVLDAFGRSLGFSMSEVVNQIAPAELIKPKPLVQYSAVISGSEIWRECLVAGALFLAGFHHFKAKVGFDPAQDIRKVSWLRRTLGGNDLRADANGAWSPAQAGEALEGMSPLGLSCIEQPVAPGMEEALPVLRKLGVPLMLDESARTITEVRHALAHGWCDFINIRISKCGGPLASVRMLSAVKEAGGRAQLGCMVGETGLLSAAGRHLACNLDGFEYLEGSYDRYLLSVHVTEPDITFGSGGWAQPLRGGGLGVTVSPRVLERFKVKEARFPW